MGQEVCHAFHCSSQGEAVLMSDQIVRKRTDGGRFLLTVGLATILTGTLTLVGTPTWTDSAPLILTRTPIPATISFRHDILPLFAGCDCHGLEAGRFAPDSYAGVAGTVNPGDPERSAMVQMMREGHHALPRLSAAELDLVIRWIREGALDN
jgi:hypothetical protein